MMVFFGITLACIIFTLIILIHEYGHYKSAKYFGVHIEEFGLGIPPRAKKLWKNKEGTLFSLNWIPLGGFVKIHGESPLLHSYFGKNKHQLSEKEIGEKIKNKQKIYDFDGHEIPNIEKKYLKDILKNRDETSAFYNKNIFAKTLILMAGVIMNFLLGGIILTIVFFIGTGPIGVNTFIDTSLNSKLLPTYEYAQDIGFIQVSPGVVLSPIDGSIAEKAGIEIGDILTSLDGRAFKESNDIIEYIHSKAGKQIKLSLYRGNNQIGYENISLVLTPNSNGKIGTYISPHISVNKNLSYDFNLAQSFIAGFQEAYIQVRLTLSGLRTLGQKIFFPENKDERQEAVSQVSGPIGIFSLITYSIQLGIIPILILTALISINIGVLNLLPIPALDGGRIVLLWIRTLISTIIGSWSLAYKLENIIHTIFFLLLIALSLIIAYNDIIKIFSP